MFRNSRVILTKYLDSNELSKMIRAYSLKQKLARIILFGMLGVVLPRALMAVPVVPRVYDATFGLKNKPFAFRGVANDDRKYLESEYRKRSILSIAREFKVSAWFIRKVFRDLGIEVLPKKSIK